MWGYVELDYKEIIELLAENSEYNFVSMICTSWHKLSFEAAKRFIEATSGEVLEGLIIVGKHKLTGYALNNNDFDENQRVCFGNVEEMKLSVCKKISYYFGLTATNQKAFYIFTPCRPNLTWTAKLKELFPDRRIVSVIIDEGLATYIEDNKGWITENIKNGADFKEKIKLYLNRYLISGWCKHRLVKSQNYIDCNLLIKEKDNDYRQNGKMFFYYAESIQKTAVRQNIKRIHMPEKYVLFNTQPFTVENGADYDMDVLQCAVDIFKKAGFTVVLKPHPREKQLERYNKLDVQMIKENNYPQEILLERMDIKPSYIVSYFSTSLVTASMFWNIPAISLAPLLIKKKDMPESDKRRLRRFMEVFKQTIYIADSGADIDSIIHNEEGQGD